MLRNTLRAGAPTLNELADITGHERSALWRTLQPLVKAGLMTLAAEKGQRAGKVAVTDKGREAVRAALPLWEASQARVQQMLGGDAEKALLETLRKVEQLAP
jgi:DNA-binding MarR family transcriptional regulator